MSSEAGFDIGDTVLEYVNTDSYWYAFRNGVLNSLKVGLMAVVLTTFLGFLVGIARLSKNWLVNKIALAYIELFRNTPILLQLFFISFVVILALPDVSNAIQPLGLPIFLANRGLSIPSAQLTSSAAIWLAFLILGIIQFQVMWIFLGRREEKTGRSSNRWGWGILSFLIIVTKWTGNEVLTPFYNSRAIQVPQLVWPVFPMGCWRYLNPCLPYRRRACSMPSMVSR